MLKYVLYPQKHKIQYFNTKRELEEAIELLKARNEPFTTEEKDFPDYDYSVVGDYLICGKVCTCLIKLAGTNEDSANKTLEEVKANPPKGCLGNIRLEKEEYNKCWWNQEKI